MANLKNKKAQRARFRYVVKVVQTVESQTAIDTNTPLTWNEIKKIPYGYTKSYEDVALELTGGDLKEAHKLLEGFSSKLIG